MKNKNLGITLLTLAVFTTTQTAEQKQGAYEPQTPWPIRPFEDAVVGAGSTVAEVVTVGNAHTGNAPTGLAVAVPDAIPGVSAARTEKTSRSQKNRSQTSQSSSRAKKRNKRDSSNE